MSKTADPPSYTQFACVGTGFSAIGLGATLKRWYGIGDIRFFERHSQLGGTWFINQYPGCACDVPSALYSFSFEPNPDWSRVLSPQRELWQYLHDVAAKYGLIDKMRFGVDVERCEWSEARGRWRMTLRRRDTGDVSLHECQFLFAATGQLMQPRELDVPGAARFRGRVLHSSRWDDTVDVEGKRVVVFGNGCTASQIVPAVVGATKHLTQVVRSRHWLLPPVDSPKADIMKKFLRYVPGTMTLQRFLVYVFTEEALRGFYMTDSGNRYRRRVQAKAESYMRATAPAKYHDKLIPDFELGCKRRIFDAGYLESLHSENLTLLDDPVREIVPEGIRTDDGVIEADVIVVANGFVTNNAVGGLEIVGRGGETIDQHWESFGGPEAYNCTIANGFPNFFILLGPNSLTGHTSAIIAAENSINFALRIIRPLLEGKGTVVEVTREAEQDYVDRLQEDMQKTVWNTGCTSWYLKDTKDGKKWNGSTWPYSQAYFWYRCLFPNFADLKISGPTHRGRRKGPWRKVALAAFVGYILSLLFGLARNPLAGNRYWQQLRAVLQILRSRLFVELQRLKS
ncbi:Dimethylaniline monooxygenase [Colletotrichum higginsianum IMI 349063]|uniref:Dimethylaniline monooxygenase n=3 Tax=Colletotrichum higginsianum TaxID=80884 RepID=A0A1B7YR98_COLHI|nr:Dimethylaniline monooxygenase [Colletotrichum higginsianum IMI 349063]OBR14566.1 Dimethylaniline monooxygenase [Colletotrichum higginsianum IMI 349063]TID02122.1 Baeyer-Villiger monooxygenase [Colletotrichum higginsianum]